MGSKKILTPANYLRSKKLGIPFEVENEESLYTWAPTTIAKILSSREYCGDVVNFKRTTKDKERNRGNKQESKDIVIFQNVHEPIIERSTWEKVQKMRANSRRKTATSSKNIFSGLLRCSDCGSILHYHAKVNSPDIAYYTCSKRENHFGFCSSNHSIRSDHLAHLVLHEINELIKQVDIDKEKLECSIKDTIEARRKGSRLIAEKKLAILESKNKELNMLSVRLFEDKVLGVISPERFHQLSTHYDSEQAEVKRRITECKNRIAANTSKAGDAERFIELLDEQMEIKELSSALLHELVDEIHVCQKERLDGRYHQKIDIYYSFVGRIESSERTVSQVAQVAQ